VISFAESPNKGKEGQSKRYPGEKGGLVLKQGIPNLKDVKRVAKEEEKYRLFNCLAWVEGGIESCCDCE